MSTNVQTTKAGGALAGLSSLKSGLANVRQNMHIPGGEPILRMGRDGIWIYGQENIEVEEGSRWAVNPLSIQHGYTCWKVIPEGSKEKPELLGEELVSFQEPKPLKTALPDYGHPWLDCVSVSLMCVSGEDKGEQVLYKVTSTGGRRALDDLLKALSAQLDADPAKPVPVVELLSDHYPHKTYGKTYFPILRIDRWVPLTEMPDSAPAGQPETDEPDEAPEPAETKAAEAPRRRAAPAPEKPAETPAPAPATGERRRRRG